MNLYDSYGGYGRYGNGFDNSIYYSSNMSNVSRKPATACSIPFDMLEL